MSRTPLLVVLLGAAAACCSDPAAAPGPALPPASNVLTGTAAKELDRQKDVVESQAKEADAMARGLLGSFEARVYDPRRDSFLDHAEGTVDVTTPAGKATYRFVFDATYPQERPVRFEAVSQSAGVTERTMADVRNWANLACLGAFPVVAFYRPPIRLQVVPSTDRKNTIVVAPVFRTPLSVSYSLDARQVVVGRAEWTDAKHKYVTNYDWDPYGGGRYLLRRAVLFEGSTTEFDYADRDGVHVLDRVHVKDRDRPIEAVFTYQSLHLRAH
jgi:hypothetical protein